MIKLAILAVAGIIATSITLTPLITKTRALFGQLVDDRMSVDTLCVNDISYLFIKITNSGNVTALATTVMFDSDGKPLVCSPRE